MAASRRESWTYGASSMGDPIAGLRAELTTLEVARRLFPMWTTWGVEDESHTVHSVGLSYLTAIGQSLGYVAAAEYPVAGPSVRADCVWWDAASRRVVAVFEFERHKDGSELVDKTRNLMRAWHVADGTPPLLGLVLWTKNFFPLDVGATRGLWRELEQGFLDASRTRVGTVPVDRLKVFECLHLAGPRGAWLLKGFQERVRQ